MGTHNFGLTDLFQELPIVNTTLSLRFSWKDREVSAYKR
jgi:hypothetical protein